MNQPRTSIIIPSYRGEAKLPTLLNALSQQSDTNFEAVVVIDGLLDNSLEIIDSFASQGVPVRAVVLEQNQGRVAALNAGFSAAKGQVLVRCDDDLEPGADFVAGHWARHQGQPCGVVGLTIDILPPSKYTRVYGATRTRAALAASYRGAIPSWRHWAANCSITRETWEKIGPYDTAYQHYGWEDVDYGYRLHEAGIPVILAPELETLHHGAATDTVKRAMRAYHSGAARRTFDQLHPGAIAPVAAGGGWWGKLVGAVASRTNEERTAQLANFTDSTIGMLPGPFATKLVALNVEAASLSGYCHSEVTTHF